MIALGRPEDCTVHNNKIEGKNISPIRLSDDWKKCRVRASTEKKRCINIFVGYL